MTYEITRMILGFQGSIPIEESEYKEICNAKKSLLVITGIEEKFDAVIENYLEYEREMLSIAMRHMVRWNLNYEVAGNDRRLVSRKLSNLLSACRMYVDQVTCDVSRLYGDTFKKHLENKTHEAYDQFRGYRVMCALRNYAQHVSWPVHSLAYRSKWENPEGRCKNGLQPLVSLPHLQKPFKKDALEDLEEMADRAPKKAKKGESERVSLTPLIRENLEALGMIHDFVRAETVGDAEKWELCLSQVLDRAKTEFGKPHSGIAVVEKDGRRIRSSEPIFDALLDSRKNLAKRSTTLGKFSARYMTGEDWDG